MSIYEDYEMLSRNEFLEKYEDSYLELLIDEGLCKDERNENYN